MQLSSLAYRTDLIFPRFEGLIHDRGDYLVILTPDNPGYRWGNLLLFAAPPAAGDLTRWLELFAREVGRPPEVQHVVFGIDGVTGEAGEVAPFLEAGFRLERSVVLLAEEVKPPPRPNSDITVRPLSETWEWEAATLNQLACRDEGESLEGYYDFLERKMLRYRKMSETGLGHWFGAFLGKELVGDMGLYRDGDVARFQSVATHPDHRRRGICGTMVHQVAQFGLSRLGVRTLVMVADPDYHAARIYASLGFEAQEQQLGLERAK